MRQYEESQRYEEHDDDMIPRELLREDTLDRCGRSGGAQAKKGRSTYSCIPDIRSWIQRGHGELSYHTSQMLTGHENFRKFLHRIGETPSDSCLFCREHAEYTVDHTILRCKGLCLAGGEATRKKPNCSRKYQARSLLRVPGTGRQRRGVLRGESPRHRSGGPSSPHLG